VSTAQSAFLSVVRAAGGLLRGVEVLLNRHGLTVTQYNVLRILRGAGERGACGREIAGQLLTAEPDITRLLDRMEKNGLVSRRRDAKDRRFVTTRISPLGVQILAELDTPVAELHDRQFESLSDAEVKKLIAVLEKLRTSPEQTQETP